MLHQSRLQHPQTTLKNLSQLSHHQKNRKTKKTLIIHTQNSYQCLHHLPKNKIKINRLQNNHRQRHPIIRKRQNLAITPKQMHPHSLKPRIHQIFNRLTRKTENKVRLPFHQHHEIPRYPLLTPRSQIKIHQH